VRVKQTTLNPAAEARPASVNCQVSGAGSILLVGRNCVKPVATSEIARHRAPDTTGRHALQHSLGVHGSSVAPDFEVEVGAGGDAGAAHARDDLALLYLLSDGNG